jgi:hypothetical protein
VTRQWERVREAGPSQERCERSKFKCLNAEKFRVGIVMTLVCV